MTTDFPMFTLSLSIWGRESLPDLGATGAGVAGAGAGGGGGVGLTDSSRFHISFLPPGVACGAKPRSRCASCRHPHVYPVPTGITRGLLYETGKWFRV